MSAGIRILAGGAGFVLWMGIAFGSPHAAAPPEDLLGAPLPGSVALTGTVLYDGPELALPTQITLGPGSIALVDGTAERPVHVLRPDGTYVAGLGSRGEGPGQFLWPRAIEPDERGSGFWVFDASLARLTRVVPEEWSRLPASARETLPLRSPSLVTNVVRREGGEYLAAGFFAEGRLGRFSPAGLYLGASGALPGPEVALPPGVVQHAYRGMLKADPARERLVLANRHAGFLEIFDEAGRSVRRIRGPHHFEPILRVKAGENGPAFASGDDLRLGYLDAWPLRDRIYALFSGRTRRAFPGEATYGRQVHVFSWDGALLSVLEMDADVMAIAVDAERNRILAVRHLPTPAIIVYPLPAVGVGRAGATS